MLLSHDASTILIKYWAARVSLALTTQPTLQKNGMSHAIKLQKLLFFPAVLFYTQLPIVLHRNYPNIKTLFPNLISVHRKLKNFCWGSDFFLSGSRLFEISVSVLINASSNYVTHSIITSRYGPLIIFHVSSHDTQLGKTVRQLIYILQNEKCTDGLMYKD